MIKNDRQYKLARAQVERFANALEELRKAPESPDEDPRIRDLQLRAIQGQIDDLKAQLNEYELLRSGKTERISVESLADLPYALIKARIASGMSQRELATRVGIKEQQIQRYEATDYAAASLTRLREVAEALDVQMRNEVRLPTERASPRSLLRRLQSAGLDPDFVRRRLAPSLNAELLEGDEQLGGAAVDVLANVTHIYGWDLETVFSDEPLQPDLQPLAAASFKLPTRISEQRLGAYVVYAHYLALLVLQATQGLEPRTPPTNWEEMRSILESRYGGISFEGVVRYSWDCGIPVLPLDDPGAMHGALWKTGGRSVIVLKQSSRSLSRWLFDLLHELYHAGLSSSSEQVILELGDSNGGLASDSIDDEEFDASQFAGDVILAGRSEVLAEWSVTRASGKLEWLKTAVKEVAREADMPIGGLAYYLAWRLSTQGENWWGAATNLQPKEDDPWRIARDILLEHANLDLLDPTSRSLLEQALTEQVR
jgi:transcriptional regulator with XRE-family HTH domain